MDTSKSSETIRHHGSAGTLNAIFHGMFAFVGHKEGIDVLIPQVDEHVMKAGTLMRELRLKEGRSYSLGGVSPSTKTPVISANNNAILTGRGELDRSPEKVFCSIHLPVPDEMLPLDFLCHPVFSGAASNPVSDTVHLVKPPTRIPRVMVLKYQFSDFTKLSLGSELAWNAELHRETGTVNLHIFSEPEVNVGKQHFMMAAAKLLSLYPGMDLTGAEPGRPEHSRAVDPGIAGMTTADVSSLIDRELPIVSGARNPAFNGDVDCWSCIGPFPGPVPDPGVPWQIADAANTR